MLRFNFYEPFITKCLDHSVRGAQYIPDITVNGKIPEEVAHKLPFERFRIWPLAFWPYPEQCKYLAFFR